MENKRKFYESETQDLIKYFTNFQEDEENFSKCIEFALDSFVYHSYLDVDPFKVKKRISGFSEKFSIKADDDKANKLRELSTRYYELLGKEDIHKRDTGYAILSLLTQLAGSCDDVDNILQDNDDEHEQDASSKINWAEYLREADKPIILSDSSSTWSESEGEDSLDSNSICLSYTVPPIGADSGIEISPDGCSSSSYIPPLGPFQTFKKRDGDNKVKERIPYWDPRYHVTKLQANSSNVNVNFTKLWEKHLFHELPIYTPETNVVLNEAVVVRETLWMLHGLKNLYIYPWANERYTVLNHIHLKHITENTLQEILLTFCQYGEKVCSLLRFVNETLSGNDKIFSHCLTYQAYACCLQYFLNEYRAKLTLYEKLVIDKKLITIIQLQQKLKPQFDELDLLFDVHSRVIENTPKNDQLWEHSMTLLDTLWKMLVEYNVWTRSKTALRILLFFFLTSLRPYINILENAIMRGRIVDPKAEFFIQRNEEVGILNEKFWNQALSFRPLPTKYEEQYFLKPLFANILLASKSMQMLHRLHHHYEFHHHHSDSTPDFLFNLFVDDFRNIFLSHNFRNSIICEDEIDFTNPEFGQNELCHHFKKLRQIKDKCINIKQHWDLCEKLVCIIQENSGLLLHSVIEQTLIPCIHNACHFTNKELIQYLKEKHNLLFHLSIIQKYFLMIRGDIMFAFYSEVFDRMLDKHFRVDLMFINNALAEAVSCFDSNISEKLSLTLSEANLSSKNQPLQLLASLKLFYDVGWPVNVILNKESQEKYCQIFGFLLQVKCAKYYLDGLYSHSLEENGESLSTVDQWLSNDAPRNQKIHGMYLMKMRMLHYINGFHNYIMSRSLHSSWIELDEKLEKAESLEDILNEHQQYLSNLLIHCLFDSKLPYLREQILKLLALALRFQNFWLAGVDKINVDDLKSIESEFSSCINLLKSYMSKPLIRGKSAHLQDLANVFITEAQSQHIFL